MIGMWIASQVSARASLLALVLTPYPQALWLSQAYGLEMLAQPTYLQTWAAGVAFFITNCWVLGEVIRGYRAPSQLKQKNR